MGGGGPANDVDDGGKKAEAEVRGVNRLRREKTLP